MAVIFGMSRLAPLGMMPSGQNVGGVGVGSGFFRACVFRRAPPNPIRSEAWKGAGLPETGRRSQERGKGQLRTTRQKPLQMWARFCGGAFRRSPQAVPEQLAQQTREGHVRSGKVLGSRFCRERSSYWPS